MKTLLILRHAKTQSDAPAGDHARELTERGHRDAAAMGAYIHDLTGTPDAIITSDATRALQTAQIVARAVAFSAPLTVESRIYNAVLNILLALVRSILDEVDTALIIGHNPGFEELAEALAGDPDEGVRLPTSGLAVLKFDVERWDAAREGAGRLREVATPRTIAGSSSRRQRPDGRASGLLGATRRVPRCKRQSAYRVTIPFPRVRTQCLTMTRRCGADRASAGYVSRHER